LSQWRKDPPRVPVEAAYHALLLLPPRDEVIDACERRFDTMLAAGALMEVSALLATGIPSTAPIMRVLGVRPLARHLAGELDLMAAATLAKTATRQYAKRQSTWFRHQFFSNSAYFTKYSESLCKEIFSDIHRFVLT
jgi:tRNA dimethylallyltransferase